MSITTATFHRMVEHQRLGVVSLITAFLVGTGCADDLPSNPTWFADVQPILAANCAHCHGAQPFDARVAGFRLDRYVAGDESTLDAWDYHDAIMAQASDLDAPAMPLDYPLTDRQREVLRRWVEDGAPKGDRSNVLPTALALSPAAGGLTLDQTLELTYLATDGDGDALVMAVGIREAGSAGGDLVVTGLPDGRQTIVLDAGQWPSKRTFQVFAALDDGYSDDPLENAHEAVLLDDVYVDHGERGTAPTVTLLTPNGGTSLIGSTTITWAASDPDEGDVLTIDLDLIEVASDGSGSVAATIAADLPNDPASFDWDVSAVPAEDSSGRPIAYKVLVTASDLGDRNVRSDPSDQTFTIAPPVGTTDLAWADVKPTFVTYCLECHGQPAKTAAIEDFRLDVYDGTDPEAEGDRGVFEQRLLVYQRLVVEGSMPQAASPQPSSAEVDAIAEWILAGAPEGGAGGDSAPTFAWSKPNDTAVSKTLADGSITLQWSASDAEGALTAGSIEYAPLSATSDATATCTAGLAGWTALPAVEVATGSYPWTAPTTGYYCFRGSATDSADQTTRDLAIKPVKYQLMGPPP